MFWVVRVDSFWYRCDTLDEAERQYQHILDNINGKYKGKDKLYLAQYDGVNAPKILKMWTRPQKEQEEEFGYGR